MRVPPFERYVRFLWGVGLLLAGMVIGSALFMSIYQHNFSLLKRENNRLIHEFQELSIENQTLAKYRNQQSIISKVIVHIERTSSVSPSLDAAIESEVRNKILADLKVLIGHPLSEISSHPQIYQRLIDKKVYYDIHQKDYSVNLRLMMLAPSQLSVWVSIHELERKLELERN